MKRTATYKPSVYTGILLVTDVVRFDDGTKN